MSIDYFGTFFTEDAFDFSGLINADLFQPVRIMYQNQHYVSAVNLLVVAIDSIAYIEYGDIKENVFVKWLKDYADFSGVGISAEELWEHRNSLLHMSNLDSRKVLSGKVRRLVAYVGELPEGLELSVNNEAYYNLRTLILAIAHAVGRWANTYNEDRESFTRSLSVTT